MAIAVSHDFLGEDPGIPGNGCIMVYVLVSNMQRKLLRIIQDILKTFLTISSTCNYFALKIFKLF